MTYQADLPDLLLGHSAGNELSAADLHGLLKLRVDVFVVEQQCPYAEVDGLDLLASTEHLWFADGTGPAAAIRILDDPAGRRIGRVVTRSDVRGQGLASRLMNQALSLIGDGPSLLEAQTYLADFYASFGYIPTGPEYLEDGIPHVPMVRAAATSSASATDRGSQ